MEIRPVTRDDFPAFMAVFNRAMGFPPAGENTLEVWRSGACQSPCSLPYSDGQKGAELEKRMRLYEFAPTRSIRVRWTLQELGVDFEAVTVNLVAGEHRRPEFLKLNPAGRVPAPKHSMPARERPEQSRIHRVRRQ